MQRQTVGAEPQGILLRTGIVVCPCPQPSIAFMQREASFVACFFSPKGTFQCHPPGYLYRGTVCYKQGQQGIDIVRHSLPCHLSRATSIVHQVTDLTAGIHPSHTVLM